MTTFSWLTATTADWNTGSDWTAGGPPNSATADAVITVGGSYTVTIAGAENFLVDSLTFSPGTGGTLALNGTLTLGGTLATMTESSGTVNLGGTIAGGTVNVNGGVLNDTGGAITGAVALNGGSVTIASGKTLTLASGMTVTSGAIIGPGTLATSGTSTLSGTSFQLDGNLVWLNSGTVNESGRVLIGYPTGSAGDVIAITNKVGAAFNLTGNGSALQLYSAATASFSNAGTLAKTVGTGTSNVQIPVTNTGLITAAVGTLEFDNGGSFGGTLNGAGVIAFAGGTSTINSGANLGSANILVSNGTLAFAGNASTTGLVMSSGTIKVASGVTLSLSGASITAGDIIGPGTLATSGTSNLSGTSFQLDGNLAWVNSGTVNESGRVLVGYPTGTAGDVIAITNKVGAAFNLTGNGSAFQTYSAATGSLSNAGTLAKTAGTATSNIQIPVTSTGVITVATGTLEFDNGGSFGGTLNGAGVIAFAGGTSTINSGANLSGANILVSGGTLAFAANASAAGLVMSSGTISVASGVTLSLSGPSITAGDIIGPGTLATSGTSNLSGTSFQLDGNLAWVNSGTVNESGRVLVGYPTGTAGDVIAITNKAAATFNLTGNGSAFQTYSAATGSLSNAGTLAKTAGTATSNIQIPVTSTGVITVATGTLEFDNGGSFGGTLNGAGVIAFAGGTSTINSGANLSGANILVSGGTLAFAANASAAGLTMMSGTISVASGVTLTLSGASITAGDIIGPGTLATSGTSTLSGTSFQLDGNLAWVNSGTVNESGRVLVGYPTGTAGDVIAITNKAAAAFNLTGNGSAFQTYSAATGSLSNSGTLAKTAGTATSNIQIPVNSTGVITAATGTLEFDNGGTFGGTLNGAGVIAFAGGSSTISSGANLTAANIQVNGGTVAFAGNASTTGLAQSGGSITVAGGITLSLASPTITAGEIVGPGTLATSGTATISGSSVGFDGNLVWVNSGTVTENGRILLDYPSGTGNIAITNQAGAAIDLTGDSTSFQLFSAGTGSLSNAGTLAKTGGTNTSSITVPVTSTGTLTASSGTLELDHASTLNGAIGGTGTGIVQLASGAAFTTTGTATILDAGTNDDLRIVSSATWTDNGVIDANGLLQIGGFSGTSALTVAGGASLAFTADDGGIVSGGGSTFSNAGLIAKTGGAGTSTINIGFTNTGTVDAASGTLKLTTGVGGSGILQIEANKTLELASGGVAGNNTVDMNGLGATLKLDTNSTLNNPIIGLGAGSRIDLAAASSMTAVINGNTLAITPAGGSELDFISTGSLANLHIQKLGDGGSGTIVTLYNVAAASAHTPEPIAFGNVHVGAVKSQALTVKNTAPANAYTENLDGTLTTSATGFTAAGSFTGLAGGATNNTALTVTLKTATTGVKNGTATITLSSDGAGVDGLGKSALPPQTVNVTGTVYALAAPVLSANTINLGAARVGAVPLIGGITLGDGSSVNAFQESLIYQFGTALPSGLTVSNAAGTLTSGHTVAVGATLSTSASGDFTATAVGAGAAGVAFTSTGAGTSGLANTVLAAPTLTVNGQVFATATANVSGSTVHFGVVHTGDVVNLVTLGVTNAVTGALTDLLSSGTVSEVGSYTGSVVESLGSGLAAGAAGTVTFGLTTTSTGVQSGTEELGFFSTDTALAPLALLDVPVTVTGTVDNFATASLKVLSGPTITGPGTAEVINLGTVQQGSGTLAVTLDVQNSATALADTLSGSFIVAGASGFTNSGFAPFSGLFAGASSGNDSVSLTTVNAGTFTETVTLDPRSDNASFNTPLAAQTLTVKGLVTPVYTLTPAPTAIVATQNLDTFIATAGALNSHDNLTGGPGGGNTLDLTGGGVFDLGAPKTLANIQLVNAAEGQAAFVSGATTIANTSQVVFLRDGLNVTLNVGAGTPNGANPHPEAITIFGGADSSIMNLGTGTDTVVLGSATEAVNGGGGTAVVKSTIAFAHAAVKGAAVGQTTLEITNGGTATLNAATTHATVKLDAASVVTLSTMGFVTAVGVVAGNTITAAATNQTLGGLAGGDKLVGFSGFGDIFSGLSAGLNGDTIAGFGGTGALADKIDLTDMALTGTPGYSGNTAQGVLTLSDGTHNVSITMLGNFVQSGFHVATDGHTGSFVTFT